jgi:hypothetical protein
MTIELRRKRATQTRQAPAQREGYRQRASRGLRICASDIDRHIEPASSSPFCHQRPRVLFFASSFVQRILFSLILVRAASCGMLANEWKSRSIYQVVTDRFAPSTAEDEARLGACSPGYLQGQFCGGTWQGIIRNLDYIQGMGFDAIWISPVCFSHWI